MSTKKYPDEKVLVIRRKLFDELGSFHGFQPQPGRYLHSILNPEHNFFLARDLAEEDPGYKQIIPYAIFHHEGRFLHYIRGSKSGEQRLASKGSIGIGGHINLEDFQESHLEKDTYMTGVEREVDEELNLETGYRQRVAGLINDDTTAVGQVHLGVVHFFDLEQPTVTSNEDTITELQFLTPEELERRFEALESWSQIALRGLEQILVTTG